MTSYLHEMVGVTIFEKYLKAPKKFKLSSNYFCWFKVYYAKFYRMSSLSRSQFHQRSTYSFYAGGAQKRKKSQIISLFTLLGSMRAKGGRKYVGEIDPRFPSLFEGVT
jgi:hypothetical protein